MSPFALPLFLFIAFQTPLTHAAESFNLTALSAVNNASVLECWQLLTPLSEFTVPGLEGLGTEQQLGKLGGNASYNVLPANFTEPAHPAPAKQFVAFLSGHLTLTIPGSNESAVIKGGKDGLIFAADTPDVTSTGHVGTTGDGEVAALQIPTRGGKAPEHRVLHRGPCVRREMGL